jgi:hypothetical protein
MYWIIIIITVEIAHHAFIPKEALTKGIVGTTVMEGVLCYSFLRHVENRWDPHSLERNVFVFDLIMEVFSIIPP